MAAFMPIRRREGGAVAPQAQKIPPDPKARGAQEERDGRSYTAGPPRRIL